MQYSNVMTFFVDLPRVEIYRIPPINFLNRNYSIT